MILHFILVFSGFLIATWAEGVQALSKNVCTIRKIRTQCKWQITPNSATVKCCMVEYIIQKKGCKPVPDIFIECGADKCDASKKNSTQHYNTVTKKLDKIATTKEPIAHRTAMTPTRKPEEQGSQKKNEDANNDDYMNLMMMFTIIILILQIIIIFILLCTLCKADKEKSETVVRVTRSPSKMEEQALIQYRQPIPTRQYSIVRPQPERTESRKVHFGDNLSKNQVRRPTPTRRVLTRKPSPYDELNYQPMVEETEHDTCDCNDPYDTYDQSPSRESTTVPTRTRTNIEDTFPGRSGEDSSQFTFRPFSDGQQPDSDSDDDYYERPTTQTIRERDVANQIDLSRRDEPRSSRSRHSLSYR